MTSQGNRDDDPDQPTVYQIRLRGHLGSQWADWFDGLTITLTDVVGAYRAIRLDGGEPVRLARGPRPRRAPPLGATARSVARYQLDELGLQHRAALDAYGAADGVTTDRGRCPMRGAIGVL